MTVSPPTAVRASSRRPSWSTLAMLAPVSSAVFTLTWLILGFLSSGYQLFDMKIAPYSAVSQPISGLGLGDTGPVMNAAFVICGAMLLAAAIGIANCWPPPTRSTLWRISAACLAATGVGMMIDGVFTFESVLPHTIGFFLALGLPALGFVLFGLWLRRAHRERRLSTVLFVAGPVTLALFVLFFLTFDPYSAGDNTGIAGLVQRVLAVEVLAVLTLLGTAAARQSAGTSTTGGSPGDDMGPGRESASRGGGGGGERV